MERSEQIRIVEALILACPEPITAARLGRITPECNAALARDLIRELNETYEKQDRAFEIWDVAGGYQVRTKAEFSGYLQQLSKQRPLRLSRAALETLSIVAYKQPATRAEVEDVRGVDAGAVLKNLMERQLVRMVGHREVPGRPMLYGTTRRFLEIFGLDSLKELPVLRELEDLAREKGVGVGVGVAVDGADQPPSDADAEAVNATPSPDGEDPEEGEQPAASVVSDAELEAAALDVAAKDSDDTADTEGSGSSEPLAGDDPVAPSSMNAEAEDAQPDDDESGERDA